MQTPGEILSAARRARELSVEDVAQRTKIPAAMISAVEADEYHKLSGPLYVRSFLRTIAQTLGEEPEKVLALYDGMSGPDTAAGEQGAAVWDGDEVVVQRLGFSWQPWMLYVLGAVVLLGVVLFTVRGCGRDSGESAGTAAAGGRPAVTADSTVAGADMPSGVTADAAPVGESTEAVAGAGDTGDTGDGNTTEQSALPVAAGAPPCPDHRNVVFSAGSGDLVLEVRLMRAVGVQVRADGQRDFRSARWPAGGVEAVEPVPDGPVDPGRLYRCGDRLVVYWRAADHFGLKLDRVSGVEVLLDGSRLSLGGLRPGQEIIIDRYSVGS